MATHPTINETHTFIRTENLSVRYGKTEALVNCSLEIPAQRVTVIIGPSGCGKSTTLRCFNKLVIPSSGSVTYEDPSLQQVQDTALRRKIGYAIQSVGLMPHMTVEENIALVPRLLGWTRDTQASRVDELLKLVRLDAQTYRDKYPSQLSGGEAQRVGVARALGADPPVLLMDEPFGAVDPLTREQLQDEFIRIQRQLKKTVVFVTHDIDEAIRLADYLVIMKDGSIVQSDTPEQILAQPANTFVEQFLGPDRALKRLSLFTADHFLEKPLAGVHDDAAQELKACDNRCYWQLDSTGKPVAGYSYTAKTLIRRAILGEQHTVREWASLKECMATMLNHGFPAVAVVDDQGRLMGEVRFEAIQRISIA
jgi:osmoprotectant transport system ATP-binding protein